MRKMPKTTPSTEDTRYVRSVQERANKLANIKTAEDSQTTALSCHRLRSPSGPNAAESRAELNKPKNRGGTLSSIHHLSLDPAQHPIIEAVGHPTPNRSVNRWTILSRSRQCHRGNENIHQGFTFHTELNIVRCTWLVARR